VAFPLQVWGRAFDAPPSASYSNCTAMEFSGATKAMKITAIAAATIIAATSAHADTYWYCKGDECVGRSVGPTNPLGTYINPIRDELEGDLSVPVHRGTYCAAGAWHHGWLRPWERSPVIKPSCGSAVYQMPH
jgi:hypothetical protein